jgi:hypothetical protein
MKKEGSGSPSYQNCMVGMENVLAASSRKDTFATPSQSCRACTTLTTSESLCRTTLAVPTKRCAGSDAVESERTQDDVQEDRRTRWKEK